MVSLNSRLLKTIHLVRVFNLFIQLALGLLAIRIRIIRQDN